MKIAIITGAFGPLPPSALGAVERLWYNMGLDMSSKGHEVIFYSKKDKGYDLSKNIVQISGYNRTGNQLADLVLDLVYSLKSLFKLRKCDLVVLNTFWTPILIPLFRWKYKKSVYNVARVPKGQYKLYRHVNQLSCVSKATANILQQQIGEDKRIVVVNNPVNLSAFTPMEEPSADGNFIIAYHGRIAEEKGLHLLCEAISKLPNHDKVELRLIGPYATEDGGSGESYAKRLKSLSEDFRLVFVGSISEPKELASNIGKCNIYCYPSIADKGETFGVSPLEAMATGRAVVVSALECFSDFIQDEYNGLVFNHRADDAIKQLSAQLKRLMESPELRCRLGKNAIETSMRFSTTNIADNYLENFENLLSSAK